MENKKLVSEKECIDAFAKIISMIVEDEDVKKDIMMGLLLSRFSAMVMTELFGEKTNGDKE